MGVCKARVHTSLSPHCPICPSTHHYPMSEGSGCRTLQLAEMLCMLVSMPCSRLETGEI